MIRLYVWHTDPRIRSRGLIARPDAGFVAAQAMPAPEKFAGRAIELAAEAITIQEFADKLRAVLGEGEDIKVRCLPEEEIDKIGRKAPGLAASLWTRDVPCEDAAEATTV
jgi:hypothetical protein